MSTDLAFVTVVKNGKSKNKNIFNDLLLEWTGQLGAEVGVNKHSIKISAEMRRIYTKVTMSGLASEEREEV